MKQELICITCPMGCHLSVEINEQKEVLSVCGNTCPRGEVYARTEITHPQRMLTSTVRIQNAICPLLPVITETTIPKELAFRVMEDIKTIKVKAPVYYKQIIKENIGGSGVNLIASRTMEEYHGK